jgi:hypothetical protein
VEGRCLAYEVEQRAFGHVLKVELGLLEGLVVVRDNVVLELNNIALC